MNRSGPARWEAAVAWLQGDGRLPSVVGGVLDGGELVWTGAVGGEALDRYRIGSITKTLTAVLVMQLRDEGRLGLDDPIGRFVPETGYADATLRQLLSHTGGLQSEPVGPWWEWSPGVDFATLMAENDGSGRVAGAGEWYHYSNLGYALLGEAAARLRGGSWWEVVVQRLLEPLGMRDTTYTDAAPRTQGYSVDHFAGTLTREPHQDTRAMAPAGQLWSTVADLARWARFLVHGHPDVLSASSVREMGQAQPASPDYGLGLRTLPVGSRRLVGHTGSMPGFQSSLFVDLSDGVGVVVLANATTGVDPAAAPALFLGSDPVPQTEPWVPTSSVPEWARPLLGLWFWGNTAIELCWHNDELHLRLLQRNVLSDTFRLDGDRIIGASGYHRGETLHVARRADGSVSHLECATFLYTRLPYDPEVPTPRRSRQAR